MRAIDAGSEYDNAPAENEVERLIVRDCVQKALCGLASSRDREILMRRYLLDHDAGSIQRDLHMSESGLKVALHRARCRFRTLLNNGNRGICDE
jgi:DNA-directed RNA polymerase specialized sigma24 family protein